MKQPKPRKKQKHDEVYYNKELNTLEIHLLTGEYLLYDTFRLMKEVKIRDRESFIKDKHYTFIGEIK